MVRIPEPTAWKANQQRDSLLGHMPRRPRYTNSLLVPLPPIPHLKAMSVGPVHQIRLLLKAGTKEWPSQAPLHDSH
jgi:hypothetical protein